MKKLIIVITSVLIITTGCQNQDPEWGYTETNGPDTWSTISEDYALCSSGQNQSPVDIQTSAVAKGKDSLKFDYTTTNFNVVDTGHSLEFEDESGANQINYNNQQYTLQQIHFHNQSENTIDGEHYPLEAHFVHANSEGQNLVISVMFELGAENPTIGDAFTKVGSEVEFNPQDLIPSNSNYYSFIGSLTTPPCTEGVQWLVFDQPLAISEQQLASFTKYYENNNRDSQLLNGREIELV